MLLTTCLSSPLMYACDGAERESIRQAAIADLPPPPPRHLASVTRLSSLSELVDAAHERVRRLAAESRADFSRATFIEAVQAEEHVRQRARKLHEKMIQVIILDEMRESLTPVRRIVTRSRMSPPHHTTDRYLTLQTKRSSCIDPNALPRAKMRKI